MRWSRVSKAYHFLKILANCVDSMLFHCFYDSWDSVSKYFLNAFIEFAQTLPQSGQLWQVHTPLSDFLRKTRSTEKHKDQFKKLKASLRCYGDSDCNKTQIIRNFHLYIIQLWELFTHIFTHADVVNAQTWEVSPPKRSGRATLQKKAKQTKN